MSAVLIVEDEKHLADGLRYNLEAEGYTIDILGNAEAALSVLLEQPKAYDVVVLDVMLPGMDGFSLASSLRAVKLRTCFVVLKLAPTTTYLSLSSCPCSRPALTPCCAAENGFTGAKLEPQAERLKRWPIPRSSTLGERP